MAVEDLETLTRDVAACWRDRMNPQDTFQWVWAVHPEATHAEVNRAFAQGWKRTGERRANPKQRVSREIRDEKQQAGLPWRAAASEVWGRYPWLSQGQINGALVLARNYRNRLSRP